MIDQFSIRMDQRQRNLLGLRVEDWTFPELVDILDNAIVHRTPIHIWGISVPLFALVRQFPEIVHFTEEFDIIVADGAGIPLFGRLLGQRIRAHIGLPHLAQEMIKLAAKKGYRLLLFGATPEVNAEAQQHILEKYPSLNLCQGIDGYYSPEAEASIAQRIKELNPDILLVGMSFPKKEEFLLRWKGLMQVPVSVACGGYFDVLAGKTKLAPKFAERMALSWLWRFAQEPRRLFSYIFINVIIFIFYIFPIAMVNHYFTPGHPLHIQRLFNLRRTDL